MVDGSRQKNLHEVRKGAIHAEMTQGITVRGENPDDFAEFMPLLPLKCCPTTGQAHSVSCRMRLPCMWNSCGQPLEDYKAIMVTVKSVGYQLRH